MTQFKYQNTVVSLKGFEGDHIAMKIADTNTFYEVSMLSFIQGLGVQDTVIDVGANIGNHTVFFAKFTNCTNVIAIEPYTAAIKLLKQNLIDNAVSQKVKVIEAAAGRAHGYCSLELGPVTNLGMTKTRPGEGVEVRTIDEIASDKKVSAIKVDVEGGELDVLRGARNVIRTQSPFLFIEAETKEYKSKIDEYLKPFGYVSLMVFNATPTYFYAKQQPKVRLR